MILSRRHGDAWYVAGINAQSETLTLKVNLSAVFGKGDKVCVYRDDMQRNPVKEEATLKNPAETAVTLLPQGGILLTK